MNSRWRIAVGLCAVLSARCALGAAAIREDYNQWKEARTNVATRAEHITALPGFKVELVRSATANEGSWVAMAFDAKGRVVIAREDRGLLRLTLTSNRTSVVRIETLATNLFECRGLLFAYDALYANANNSKALVQLRDTNGDDQFDEIKVMRHTPGGVGHGRNQLALGPDGFIYSIHGDDVGLPTNGVSASSPFQHYAEDRLIPCTWDKYLFNAVASMPYGHLIRTDRDGTRWELMAGGLRNPFGIDFNEAGDLFTFDADMEWDVGLSWYHPTRVLHLVPGGDYGWRRGTGVLPVWSPDTLPSAVDIGVSSPTAIKFGTKSNWPEPWRSALFIEDWAYGRIVAVHLQKRGASYTGRTELFLKGRPLNVTGIEFGPDGAMYFTTGGRRTQSGLYRVTWTNGTTRDQPRSAPKTRSQNNLWTRLNDRDHWVRHAARIELESRPVHEWSSRALKEERPAGALTALLALSRVGESSLQPKIVSRLTELSSSKLTADEQLITLRALGVSFIRMGTPVEQISRRICALWEPQFPTADARVNQSLCEMLVYLGSKNIVGKTIPLLASAPTQEEKFHYLFTLRTVTNGWTLAHRKTYFEWLGRARREFQGANNLPTSLNYIRADAEATLTAAERDGLKEVLASLNNTQPVPPPVAREFVKEWTMNDLVGDLGRAGGARDLLRGKRLFSEVGCVQCHRLGNEGGFVGPELTSVSSRFDRRTILESVIEPSKVVAEVYRPVTVTLKSGEIFDGRIESEDTKGFVLAINSVDPDRKRKMNRAEVASVRMSETSTMPAGLLNTLTRDEVFDLLAWIESGGGNSP
jgi:putative heme-binding domain-containing protein